jgi:hypothetical protein
MTTICSISAGMKELVVIGIFDDAEITDECIGAGKRGWSLPARDGLLGFLFCVPERIII